MPSRISGIGRDCRWLLLLVISLLISLNAYRDKIGHPVARGGATNITPRTWLEMGLRWDFAGPNGVGAYGRALNVTQSNAEQLGNDVGNSRLNNPRLAIFVFRPFDLNQVDIDTLQIIRGIGPKLATAIVDYRLAHGQFHNIDDLLAIKGIGPKKLTSLRSHLVIYPAHSD